MFSNLSLKNSQYSLTLSCKLRLSGFDFYLFVWFFKLPLFFLLWWWSGGAQGRWQFSRDWNRRWYWSWLRSESSNKQKLYLLTAENHQHKILKTWKQLVTFVNQFNVAQENSRNTNIAAWSQFLITINHSTQDFHLLVLPKSK